METYHNIVTLIVGAISFLFIGLLIDRLLYTAADEKIGRNMILLSTFAYFVSAIMACVCILKVLYLFVPCTR